jgi:hypothetical protein
VAALNPTLGGETFNPGAVLMAQNPASGVLKLNPVLGGNAAPINHVEFGLPAASFPVECRSP